MGKLEAQVLALFLCTPSLSFLTHKVGIALELQGAGGVIQDTLRWSPPGGREDPHVHAGKALPSLSIRAIWGYIESFKIGIQKPNSILVVAHSVPFTEHRISALRCTNRESDDLKG